MATLLAEECIAEMNFRELEDVLDAVKRRRAVLNMGFTMSVDDRVVIRHKGRHLAGVITKVNRTKCEITTDDGDRWRVPFSLIEEGSIPLTEA
jgi:hypothetical protein